MKDSGAVNEAQRLSKWAESSTKKEGGVVYELSVSPSTVVL